MNFVDLDTLNRMCFPHNPVARQKLQRWCRRSVLPAKKLGGDWFVDLDRLGEVTAGSDTKGPAEVVRLVVDKMMARRP